MHVVITGGSSGIGAALARELHARGAHVTLVARRRALMFAIAAELKERCQVIVRDLREAPVAEWLSDLQDGERGEEEGSWQELERFGPVDVFINNAGIQNAGQFEISDEGTGRRIIDVDLLVPLALAREIVPRMLRRGKGVLVNISSVAALVPPAGMAWYVAAKAGLAAFSETLSAELRGSGVHVLTVYPGPIDNGSEQASYDLYGRDSIARCLPVGKASALAVQISRAITRRRRRLIYPAIYGLAWWATPFVRWLVNRATPKLRSEGR